MKINAAGLDLIKRWEGLRLTAYQDSVGVWTIGYGHTAEAGPPAPKAGMKITEKEATDILARDLGQYARRHQGHLGCPDVQPVRRDDQPLLQHWTNQLRRVFRRAPHERGQPQGRSGRLPAVEQGGRQSAERLDGAP